MLPPGAPCLSQDSFPIPRHEGVGGWVEHIEQNVGPSEYAKWDVTPCPLGGKPHQLITQLIANTSHDHSRERAPKGPPQYIDAKPTSCEMLQRIYHQNPRGHCLARTRNQLYHTVLWQGDHSKPGLKAIKLIGMPSGDCACKTQRTTTIHPAHVSVRIPSWRVRIQALCMQTHYLNAPWSMHCTLLKKNGHALSSKGGGLSI